MKKTTIATLVAAMMAVPAMSAQAADNEVNVYGQIRLSVDNNSDDFGAGSEGTGMKSNSSRLGVKGSMPTTLSGTDLIYKAEIRYGAADEKTAEIEWREGYGGLKGSWGKLRAGRLSVHYKTSGTKIDPWTDNIPQGRQSSKQGMSSLHSSYFNNALEYITPKFGNLSAGVWHSMQFDGETGAPTDKVGTIHNAGPINKYKGGTASGAGVRYTDKNWFVSADVLDIDADSVTSANMANGSGSQLAVRYKSGPFSIAAFYEDVEDLGLGTNTYLNGIYRVGHTRLIATLGSNSDATQFGNQDIDTWSLGAKYDLTKKSELFAAFNSRDEGANTFDTFTVGLNAKFGY
ncbi:porin [Thiohalophilus sp.]|uniref:porin n=1 Tax=Thiohalophilus sp. TaxID=3028392 RepID=UPI002ACE66DA|nr:porin [Thiohalophilus sp.]MDZ7802722.1 porin [Thiohalophilus sp.]